MTLKQSRDHYRPSPRHLAETPCPGGPADGLGPDVRLVKGDRVIGYFSLTVGSVLRARRRESWCEAYRPIRWAWSCSPVWPSASAAQGQGLGALLLAEALRKAVIAGEAAAARLVVVDAIDEDAARFYARHGFIAVPEHPYRLYRRMKDVRMSVEAPDGS